MKPFKLFTFVLSTVLATQQGFAAANLILLGSNACSAVPTDETTLITAKHCVMKAEDAELKGALQQCQADKDQIIKELRQENLFIHSPQGVEGGGLVRPEGGGNTLNPTLTPGARPKKKGKVCFSSGGGPWICKSDQAVSSSTSNFVTIARTAFVHKFLEAAGHGPTYEEAARGGRAMLEGSVPDMDAVYQTAINPSPPPPPAPPKPALTQPIKNKRCVSRCQIEK